MEGTQLQLTRQISFKKQTANQWRRIDGDPLGACTKSHVKPDAMHREIQKLVNDGWRIVVENHRMIVLHYYAPDVEAIIEDTENFSVAARYSRP